jgi:hypothetical protein
MVIDLELACKFFEYKIKWNGKQAMIHWMENQINWKSRPNYDGRYQTWYRGHSGRIWENKCQSIYNIWNMHIYFKPSLLENTSNDSSGRWFKSFKWGSLLFSVILWSLALSHRNMSFFTHYTQRPYKLFPISFMVSHIISMFYQHIQRV